MVLPLIPIAMTLAQQFLPSLVGHLAGDKGEDVARKVMSAATAITGHDNADAALQALNDNPELALRFRQELTNIEKVHAGDRANAREMAKTTGIAPQLVLSVLYTVAYGLVLYMFMSGKITVPDNQHVLFGSLIGVLTAAQVQILNFWFGSSSGSKEKTAHLAGGARG